MDDPQRKLANFVWIQNENNAEAVFHTVGSGLLL